MHFHECKTNCCIEMDPISILKGGIILRFTKIKEICTLLARNDKLHQSYNVSGAQFSAFLHKSFIKLVTDKVPNSP